MIGAELALSLDSAGQMRSLSGEVTADLGAPPFTARITAAQAQRTAALAAGKHHGLPITALVASEPELSIYDASVIGPDLDSPPALVWRIEVTSVAAAPVREFILIDALSGGLALRFNQAETARNRLTYTANNTGVLPGALLCNESQPLCTSGANADADAAHRYAGDTYDFYRCAMEGTATTTLAPRSAPSCNSRRRASVQTQPGTERRCCTARARPRRTTS